MAMLCLPEKCIVLHPNCSLYNIALAPRVNAPLQKGKMLESKCAERNINDSSQGLGVSSKV